MLSTLTRCSLKGLKTVPLHACLAMSRTPSPDRWHPAVGRSTWQVPVCVVYVRAPQAHVSGVHPRALGRFVALTRLCPSNRLQTSIDAFLGWLLYRSLHDAHATKSAAATAPACMAAATTRWLSQCTAEVARSICHLRFGPGTCVTHEDFAIRRLGLKYPLQPPRQMLGKQQTWRKSST